LSGRSPRWQRYGQVDTPTPEGEPAEQRHDLVPCRDCRGEPGERRIADSIWQENHSARHVLGAEAQ
jgi:ribosomal protein L37AE/L43A